MLGGLVRSAIPFVSKVAKSAGAKLLNAGLNFAADQIKRKRPTKKRAAKGDSLPRNQNKRSGTKQTKPVKRLKRSETF